MELDLCLQLLIKLQVTRLSFLKLIKNYSKFKKNLNNNCSNFKIYKGNLLLNKRDKFNFYYSNRNFLASSLYRKDGVKKKLKLLV